MRKLAAVVVTMVAVVVTMAVVAKKLAVVVTRNDRRAPDSSPPFHHWRFAVEENGRLRPFQCVWT